MGFSARAEKYLKGLRRDRKWISEEYVWTEGICNPRLSEYEDLQIRKINTYLNITLRYK